MLFPKRKRVVDPKHLERIRELPCCVCGFPESEAHHLKGWQNVRSGDGGVGVKADDDETIPLCHAHHMELHLWGWKSWEAVYGKQKKFLKETRERLK